MEQTAQICSKTSFSNTVLSMSVEGLPRRLCAAEPPDGATSDNWEGSLEEDRESPAEILELRS
jgi:hypothetical protein